MPPMTLPPEAQEPSFVTLYNVWRQLCRPGRLPSRQDFDPADLPPSLLSHVLLFDVDRQGERLRFRFRVAGTAFSALVGREATGRYLDELGPPERTQAVQSALELIVQTGRPVFLGGRLTLVNRDYFSVKRLGLPLARDGATVSMVLSIFALIRRDLLDESSEPDSDLRIQL